MREFELARLRVDGEEFDIDLVAFLESGVFHLLDATPLDFGDVQQTFLAWHELDEASVRHDALDGGVVNLADLRDGNDGADAADGRVHALLVVGGDFDASAVVVFVNGDDSPRFGLYALDDFSTRSDDSPDELLRYGEHLDARCLRFEFRTRFGDAFGDFVEDEESSFLGLREGALENLVGEAVHLDVHLGSRDAVLGSRHLEIHVAEVVLVTEDVGEDSVVGALVLADETHGNTCHRFLDFDTGIHQSERSGADGSHRRGAVALEDVAHDAHDVRIVSRNHAFEGSPSEVSVTDFTTADATLSLGFARAERREVVVEEEALLALFECLVNDFFVLLGSEGDGAEALSLTTGKDAAAVGSREVADLAPDRSNLVELATVQTLVLVKDATAHGVTLHVVVVAVDEGTFGFEFLFGELRLEVFANLLEASFAFVLVGTATAGERISLVVALLAHLLTEFVIVLLVAVFTFCLATLLHEFELRLALNLDGIVSRFEGTEEVSFADFVHFTFDHHDVVNGGSDHEIHVRLLHLGEGRVDDVLSVDAHHAHFADRTFPRHIADAEGRGGCKSGKGIRLINAIGAEERHLNESLSVVVAWEKRSEGTVNETRNEDFVVVRSSFAARESARETSRGTELFFVIDRERHEVGSRNSVLRAANGGEEHGVATSYHHATVRLLCEFAGFDGDGSSITHCDGLCHYIHFLFYVLLLVGREIRKKIHI